MRAYGVQLNCQVSWCTCCSYEGKDGKYEEGDGEGGDTEREEVGEGGGGSAGAIVAGILLPLLLLAVTATVAVVVLLVWRRRYSKSVLSYQSVYGSL